VLNQLSVLHRLTGDYPAAASPSADLHGNRTPSGAEKWLACLSGSPFVHMPGDCDEVGMGTGAELVQLRLRMPGWRLIGLVDDPVGGGGIGEHPCGGFEQVDGDGEDRLSGQVIVGFNAGVRSDRLISKECDRGFHHGQEHHDIAPEGGDQQRAPVIEGIAHHRAGQGQQRLPPLAFVPVGGDQR